MKRCWECGFGVTKPAYASIPWQCPRHPDAEMILWPSGRGFSVADKYLEQMARKGEDLDRWIERYSPIAFPGASQADMAFVLARRKAWGYWGDGTAVGEIPETVREPIRMYGKARW